MLGLAMAIARAMQVSKEDTTASTDVSIVYSPATKSQQPQCPFPQLQTWSARTLTLSQHDKSFQIVNLYLFPIQYLLNVFFLPLVGYDWLVRNTF